MIWIPGDWMHLIPKSPSRICHPRSQIGPPTAARTLTEHFSQNLKDSIKGYPEVEDKPLFIDYLKLDTVATIIRVDDITALLDLLLIVQDMLSQSDQGQQRGRRV